MEHTEMNLSDNSQGPIHGLLDTWNNDVPQDHLACRELLSKI